ncbi:MAG: hypothetical protein AAFV96_15125 [Pseudomonadota bacterium]
MVRLVPAGNADTAAFAVLCSLGYELSLVPGAEEERICAKKDGHEFVAESPITVLGLVALHQARGDDWKPRDDEVARMLRFEAQRRI